jgi:hypothetical protein
MVHTDKTLQETLTSLSGAEVLERAKHFFSRRNSIYTSFLDMEGPTFVSLRGMGGEEVVIGVAQRGGATAVTGSTYLFDQQVARFLAALPLANAAGAPETPLELPASSDATAASVTA